MDQNRCRQKYVWAIIEVIFSYTGSPEKKIRQKALGGYFFDSHCRFKHFIALAIVNSRSRSLYVVVNPSVSLSVTFARTSW